MKSQSKIGLGSVQFGTNYGISNASGKSTLAEVRQIIDLAQAHNIDTIDTALAYGDAEEVLGEIGVSSFKIVSKFSPPTKELSIEKQLNLSTAKLKIDSLYAYLAHRPEDVIAKPEQWVEVDKLKRLGLIKKIGFSFNETHELDSILELKIFPDIIQVPFNYLDKRFEKYFEKLKGMNCEIHTRSSFLQGLFFVPPHRLDVFFNPVKSILTDLQRKYKDSLHQVLLDHVLSHPLIDKVIVGVETAAQLTLNLTQNDIMQLDPLPIHTNLSKQILMPMYWPKSK